MTSTPAHVIVRDRDGHAVVTPQGPLYFDTIQPVTDALLPLSAGERPRIVLDLSAVRLCDSSGLNLMAQTRRLATGKGGWLRLVAPQPGVRRVLEATNLVRILPIYDTVEAAIRDA